MLFIRQGATHKVVVGPAVAVGDGFTPITNLNIGTADDAEAILHDNGTVVDISGYTLNAIATADGYYHLTLQNAISGTVGHLTIVINDDSLMLPLRADFTVLDTAPYDANFKDAAVGPLTTKTGFTLTNFTDASAGKLDDMLDGTGGVTVSLGRLVLSTNHADGAISVINTGGGAFLLSGTTLGIYCDASAGTGMLITGTDSDITADIVGTISWNAAWDAEVQSECADALTAYDPPTKAEMDTAHGLLATEAKQDIIDGIVDDILVDTAEIGAAGAGLTDLGGMSSTMKGQVNAEVVDCLNTDTYAEPGQGTPGATLSLAAKIGYLFKNWRNKKTQTATEWDLLNDDAATVDQKAVVSSDGTTVTKGEIGTGP